MTNPDVTDLFRQQFRRELRAGRFAMAFAHSAVEALEWINGSNEPSLILMLSDINMPGMTGPELLPLVRAARPDVPVIRDHGLRRRRDAREGPSRRRRGA